ncbi:agmatine deiminase family protein [Candidatus Peregrinibacteria bacterium]|nr:agmatine deiminase family protein [Candidatus Peregrinibacteria bacterium]
MNFLPQKNAGSYLMPAEWEPHQGTWLAWPHNLDHWPGKFEKIPPVYAKIVNALLEGGEEVFICVNDEEMERSARKILPQKVKFFQIPTNASWSRDHGPIFVRDKTGKLIIEDWIFNAWGDQWPHDKDDIVPQKIAEQLKLPLVQPGIVLEGGSIDVNGKGLLLTTTQCLLNKNRNPHLTQKQIEKYLRDYLGAEKILWLEEGIIGDDTSGHIDDIARFTDEKTIVAAVEENPKDENYKILKKNFEDLKNMTDQNGKPFKIVPIPMPEPVICEGQRLPASYINFYIANKAVLVPIFRGKNDARALKILAELFLTRKIIGIDCVDLVWGLGTIHCLTQQQPA